MCSLSELTKIYEEVIRGSLSYVIDLLSKRNSIKGECVILMEKMKRMYFSKSPCLFHLRELMDGKSATKILSEELKVLGYNSIILREPGGSIISEKLEIFYFIII